MLVPALLLPLLAPAAAAPAAVPEEARREIVRTLEGLEREWFKVYETHDLAPLEGLMADDFVATLADGAVRGKREHIAAYRADFEAIERVENSDMRVRVHTADLAVVTGLYTATLRDRSAADAVSRYRYTDTWLRRGGRWQCVATHESRLE
ncbi:MAG TPA: nuclear transport factor 2 family protein [Vicinamibacteria bacterium]|nr:nuclear transport factor 2 family protein [Vicinamibacteria bacterium]